MAILNSENTIDRIIGFWQTEDLLRAYHFDIPKLLSRPFMSDQLRGGEASQFLIELKEAMEKEDVLLQGHTYHSKSLIEPKEAFHAELLQSNAEYHKSFKGLEPAILKYNTQQPVHQGVVMIMFEILYAYYLKKISGDDMNERVAELAKNAGYCLETLYA